MGNWTIAELSDDPCASLLERREAARAAREAAEEALSAVAGIPPALVRRIKSAKDASRRYRDSVRRLEVLVDAQRAPRRPQDEERQRLQAQADALALELREAHDELEATERRLAVAYGPDADPADPAVDAERQRIRPEVERRLTRAFERTKRRLDPEQLASAAAEHAEAMQILDLPEGEDLVRQTLLRARAHNVELVRQTAVTVRRQLDGLSDPEADARDLDTRQRFAAALEGWERCAAQEANLRKRAGVDGAEIAASHALVMAVGAEVAAIRDLQACLDYGAPSDTR